MADSVHQLTHTWPHSVRGLSNLRTQKLVKGLLVCTMKEHVLSGYETGSQKTRLSKERWRFINLWLLLSMRAFFRSFALDTRE